MSFNGTGNGTLAYAAGQSGFGQALDTTGGGDVTLAHGACDIDPAVAFTWEGWYKASGTPGGVLISRSGTGNGGDAYIYFGNATTVQFHIPGQSTGTPISSIADSAWHHVAMVYDGAGNLAGYIDGARVALFTGQTFPASDTGGQGQIGNYTTGFRLIGFIDEVRISSSARYSGSSFTVPTAPFTPDGNTVALYHFQNDLTDAAGAATPSMAVSPTTAITGTPLTVTATGTNTSWVNGTTTFSVTGGTGASISALSINNGTQVATFTLTPGSAAGTLTIHNSTDSGTATLTVSAAPVAGTASVVWLGKTTAELATTAATGGSGSSTNQWDMAIGAGSFAPISGATGLTRRVTGLDPNSAYHFRCRQTDGGTTVTTNVLDVTTYKTTDVIYGVIGHSRDVTDNATANPGPGLALASVVTLSNGNKVVEGFNFAHSGYDTVQILAVAEAARTSTGVINYGELQTDGPARPWSEREVDYVLIGGGYVNDLKTVGGHDNATILTNLGAIADSCIAGGAIHVIFEYEYHMPPAIPGAWDPTSNTRIDAINAALSTLANGTTKLVGDTTINDYTDANPTQVPDHLHGDTTFAAHWGGVCWRDDLNLKTTPATTASELSKLALEILPVGDRRTLTALGRFGGG